MYTHARSPISQGSSRMPVVHSSGFHSGHTLPYFIDNIDTPGHTLPYFAGQLASDVHSSGFHSGRLWGLQPGSLPPKHTHEYRHTPPSPPQNTHMNTPTKAPTVPTTLPCLVGQLAPGVLLRLQLWPAGGPAAGAPLGPAARGAGAGDPARGLQGGQSSQSSGHCL